ncbi:hypothetical protein [Corynebacterium aquatimens]|uniref:Uncharacterized protein n=1 Tax=Corynebacterium aquatimens TaxID=1190508 RepID=A0A931E376_9CORY|nr:hypothetical protein [Corynebacterium aquatimens]MBG6122366.1 hypothetical protein [Corynebacterium aquatimens]WJY65091.1 hypothetical protein CAQUA_01790 [Corynebacterium aquatimens]
MSFDLIKDVISALYDIIKGFIDLFDKDSEGKFEVFEPLKKLFTETLKPENLKAAFDKDNAEGFSSKKPEAVK